MTRPAPSTRRLSLRSPIRRARDFLIRLGVDQRGVSAIEFALIAPVMIVFYFALTEFSQAFMAQKRVAHSASAVADLVAQASVVSTSDLDDIVAIGALIMKPYSAATLTTRVSSVTRDSKGVAKVVWSRASGVAAYKPLDVVTVPTDMIGNGASVVMSETTYNYDSPVKYLMPNTIKLTSVFYSLPRKVATVTCSNC